MRLTGWIVGSAIVAGLAGIAVADDEARPQPVAATCGHVEELAAARRALEQGDSQLALRHLRTADALLSRCLKKDPPAPPDNRGEVDETQNG